MAEREGRSMVNAVMKARRPTAKRPWPNGKPVAWKKLPRSRAEHEYPETVHKLRAWLRDEIKECRRRAANAKWYAAVTKNDAPDSRSHADWLQQRRERVVMALDARKRLRATHY